MAAVAEPRSGDGRRLVLLGPPGSGKGTQAELLARWAGIPAISTGRMLRQAVRSGDSLGERVEDVMASGDLVDDATMAEVVRGRLGATDAARGFVLDGYPRTLGQARDLERILDDLPAHLDAVIAIEVPEEELVRRALARQRADDTTDVIRERLRVYHRETEPLIDHYRGTELLSEVDGDQTIDEVFDTIVAAIDGEES
ncbi:MAG: adenylate kinase [Thermoanaerobaculia bacterium]|nr:adenylate kinase [Thermoanaerobaculia bacterium]